MTDAQKIINCFKKGNKLLIIGNGGSAAMAQHLAAEFICKMEKDRKPLPAIALTTDTSNITAIGNDFGFKWVFQRQITALGKAGDILLVFTTSDHMWIGKDDKYVHSENLSHAEAQAKLSNIDVIVAPRRGNTTAERQEYQFKWMHDLAREVELAFV